MARELTKSVVAVLINIFPSIPNSFPITSIIIAILLTIYILPNTLQNSEGCTFPNTPVCKYVPDKKASTANENLVEKYDTKLLPLLSTVFGQSSCCTDQQFLASFQLRHSF